MFYDFPVPGTISISLSFRVLAHSTFGTHSTNWICRALFFLFASNCRDNAEWFYHSSSISFVLPSSKITMHIKQITISNFRSFRQQGEIYPFAPTTNCVVGRNGSGKSNLFDAVQFVLLSPRFATLRSVSLKTRLVKQRNVLSTTNFSSSNSQF